MTLNVFSEGGGFAGLVLGVVDGELQRGVTLQISTHDGTATGLYVCFLTHAHIIAGLIALTIRLVETKCTVYAL